MSNPELHTCHVCGHQWRHGQHGGHDCIGRVTVQRDELLDALKECVEDSEQAVGEYVEKYGETYRPQRLQAMRDTVTKARAAIAKAEGGAA